MVVKINNKEYVHISDYAKLKKMKLNTAQWQVRKGKILKVMKMKGGWYVEVSKNNTNVVKDIFNNK